MTTASLTKMSNIDAEIAAIGQMTVATNSTAKTIDEKLARILNGRTLTDVDVDLKGEFDAASKKAKATQQNLATLIQSLNETSKGFVDQFKEMSQESRWEKIVRIFDKDRAEVMKTDRINKASIEDNLNELIQRSDRLLMALKEQLVTLEASYQNVLVGQKRVNEKYELGEAERVQLSADIERLTVERNALQSRIASLSTDTVATERAALETDFAELSNEFNVANERLQTRMGLQLKLAGHRESYSTFAYSEALVIATQKAMIAGLEIDTEEDATKFDALTEVLKGSKKQEYGANLNLTGQMARSMADELMLQLGQSGRNSVVSTMKTDRAFADKAASFKARREQADREFAQDMAKLQAEFGITNKGV